MRKILLRAFIILPILALSGVAFSGSKGVSKLVGGYSDWAGDLSRSREFGKKTVLLEVLDEKKSTTVEGLLSTVQLVLSPAQQGIFVAPLVLAEHQNVAYASVTIDGAIVKEVALQGQPPAAQAGVAAIVLSYKGDTTLPRQVLVNLKSQ